MARGGLRVAARARVRRPRRPGRRAVRAHRPRPGRGRPDVPRHIPRAPGRSDCRDRRRRSPAPRLPRGPACPPSRVVAGRPPPGRPTGRSPGARHPRPAAGGMSRQAVARPWRPQRGSRRAGHARRGRRCPAAAACSCPRAPPLRRPRLPPSRPVDAVGTGEERPPHHLPPSSHPPGERVSRSARRPRRSRQGRAWRRRPPATRGRWCAPTPTPCGQRTRCRTAVERRSGRDRWRGHPRSTATACVPGARCAGWPIRFPDRVPGAAARRRACR